MLQLSLDPHDATPLVEQIVSGVRAQIEDRILRPGMRLPPIRRLAEQQQISRFTVVEAYDRLVALGYLHSRRGSGFYVAPRQAAPVLEPDENALERAVDVAWVLRQALDDDSDRLKVGKGWLPPAWMDEEGLRRNLRSLTRRAGMRLTEYGTPMGYLPLRQQLQLRLAELGIGARPNQILLTQGATQALDVVNRYLIKPGDCVFVDDPGYFNLFGALRLCGATLVGVPHTPGGPDPVALEALLQTHRPKAFYTHSVLHNPTASSLSPATAFRILQLAERHNFLIVEDDTYCDFNPGPATRLANLDQLNRVIYVGSYSKTLSAALRVGFLACHGDLAGDLTDVKMLTSVASSEFAERLVYLMLTEGHYRKYIERLQARLDDCMGRSLRMFERNGLSVYGEPKSGMFIWASLPGVEDSAGLAAVAARQDIMLAPGNVFRPQMQASPWIRFNVAVSADPRLERFLGQALEVPSVVRA